jgi:hypothetical protein
MQREERNADRRADEVKKSYRGSALMNADRRGSGALPKSPKLPKIAEIENTNFRTKSHHGKERQRRAGERISILVFPAILAMLAISREFSSC